MISKTSSKIMLIDFGIAENFKDDKYRYSTQAVLKLGTEGYMPPEQSNTLIYEEEEKSGIDQRSDIYSLGATLYYFLTKTIPRDSICRAIDFRRYGEDRLPLIRKINPNISRNTEEVVLKAIQLCKEDRYQTIDEFEEALFLAYASPVTMTHPIDSSEMILVPEGYFWMGSNDEGEDEKPKRKLYLEAYYIDKYPITYGQFKQFVGATGYKRKTIDSDTAYVTEEWHRYYQPGRENYPAVNINWYDAKAYAQWAGKDLPSEEQWEKAARGRNGIVYPWGNKWDNGKCNSFFLSNPELMSKAIPMWRGSKGTLPIGCFPDGVSPYGVMEMAGNVLEWTDSDYTIQNAKVVRGGCWYRDAPGYFRCAKRYWYFAGYSVNWLGARCVINKRG
jgi:sulfatase modifying factor 1